ncbi:MAG: polysaccharide biosynthesis protein [Alphaproteobacteria bacterium]|nr:polysaccharide biosynthesis protein [Alphaproteobacteria bacterium]
MNGDLRDFYQGKRVLVTGAGGSIGSRLVESLLTMPVAEVRGVDIHESSLFQLQERFGSDPRLVPMLCDVRDEFETNRVFSGVNYCLHTAALKHVPFCERNPFSAVQTNIIGAQVVIRAALANKVERVLFTSSDKAVNPTNVMGASKLMAERLFVAANNLEDRQNASIFSATRFGNVAGTAGSVIPLFSRQIAAGGPVTLTDPEMTRFVMTINQAVRLVLQSMALARGGEVFVMKMPVVSISDLAETMIDVLAPAFGRKPEGVPIQVIGQRQGEKVWEELTTDEEVRRAYDLDRDFLIILPAIGHSKASDDDEYRRLTKLGKTYHSANEILMSKQEIKDFLLSPSVLPIEARERLGIARGQQP